MRHIVIAPFANNDLREWPLPSYAALIGLLLAWPDIEVTIVGTTGQRARAEALMRPRVKNLCGQIDWHSLDALCATADCVVGNNSGVAHLAGRLGAPMVCVFGGANDRTEWGALGPNVTLISQPVACSPCHLSRASDCPHHLACLHNIAAATVAGVIAARLAENQGEERGPSPRGPTAWARPDAALPRPDAAR